MSDSIEIRFPEEQEGTEATVTRWLVGEGDSVDQHDPVVEIETDKVVVEVAAPETGVIADIKIHQDEAVNPGDLLCMLKTGLETPVEAGSVAVAETASDTKSGLSGQNRLSPAVRQRVKDHKLDISGLAGSGQDGRITLQDLEPLIARQAATDAEHPATAADGAIEDTEIIPHDRMRKRIAESMVASLMHTAPHVTAVFEADLSAILQHRSAHREDFAKRGTPLTLTAYFARACILAIQKVPRVNSRWTEHHLEVFHHVNLGIGTALGDAGLIVPVIHNAHQMDLNALAASLDDLTSRARNSQLQPQDVRGGTFTISNHGVSGSLIATPIIINQPQSAILGIGKIEKRVKIREIAGEDVIAVRPMCYVSLTIDHRVLDGYQTNSFLTEFVNCLENWPRES